MKLYRKADGRDIRKLTAQLKNASGNKTNRLPHGVGGVLCFELGDIFLSDRLFSLLTANIRLEIDDCLRRIIKDDYGAVGDDTIEANGESRYLGNGAGVVGKYQISIGEIQISRLDIHTYIDFVC